MVALIIISSIVGGIGLILYWCYICHLCEQAFAHKGYSGGFWLCFFTGVFAYLYVLALPDRSNEVKASSYLAKKTTSNPYVETIKKQNPTPIKKTESYWICKKCGQKNSNNTTCCISCSSYK